MTEFSAPHVETVSTDPPDWIGALAFTPRKQSWVAVSPGCFYKIIRNSDDPLRDVMDPVCIDAALREYNDMLFLSTLSDRACCPLRIEHGCIVYPYLSGPDMRVLLRSNTTHGRREACLREAVVLLAQFHISAGNALDYPLRDYQCNSYLAADGNIAKRLTEMNKTIVIGGFEVRNLRFDKVRSTWRFFDPQHVWRGAPEEDFARFVVSLLMVNWGRDGVLGCWSAFDISDLLAVYQRAASLSLDKALLGYFLREKLAMRKFFAKKTLRTMNLAWQIAGWPYLMMYFRQLEAWRSAHEF